MEKVERLLMSDIVSDELKGRIVLKAAGKKQNQMAVQVLICTSTNQKIPANEITADH